MAGEMSSGKRPGDTDMDHVGSLCSLEYCGQRDFLPYTCDRCARCFCGDHRTYKAHGCTAPEPVTDEGTGRTPLNKFKCSRDGCPRSEMVPVTCEACSLMFCLDHRHPRDHDCKPPVAAAAPKRLTAKEMLAKQRGEDPSVGTGANSGAGAGAGASSGTGGSEGADAGGSAEVAAPKRKKPKKVLNEKAKARLAAARLIKVKRRAEGKGGIPDSEKFYLEVHFGRSGSPSMTPGSKGSVVAMCFDKTWTVGRLLDALARRAGISNPNGDTTDPAKRLNLFLTDEDGDVLTGDEAGADGAAALPFAPTLAALAEAPGAFTSGAPVALIKGLP